MFTIISIVIALVLLGYVLRRNFRRAWHVLRTGDDNPDWEKLGGDHYIADWERIFWKLSRSKKAADAPQSMNGEA